MAFDFSTTWNLIKHGNINALKHLFVETSQQLIKYAYRISHDNFIAEEVVQDTFLNLWNNRENILITGSVKAYLYQSVHNQTINKLKQKTNQHNSIGMLVSDDTWQYLEEYSQINENVIQKLEAEDCEKIINEIIDSLPDQCRQIFKLSRFQQMSNTEIATKLNISVSTVKTQIYRAIDKIRQEFYK